MYDFEDHQDRISPEIKRRTSRPGRLNLFHSFHKVNGVNLHVAEAGTEGKPLVILLHGFPEFWWGWRHQIRALALSGFHVLAPDQRGYHLSSKPLEIGSYHLDALATDILELADQFHAKTFHLVGHDWGGMVAWWISAHHPERIQRLAILNAPHPVVTQTYLLTHPTQLIRSSYISLFQLPKVPEYLLKRNDFALLRQILRRSSRSGTFSDRDLEAYVDAWSKADALSSMLNWYRALRHYSSDSRELEISPETLILWGAKDQFLEPSLAEESCDHCRRCRVKRLDSATHWLHLEEPQLVNRSLIEFFNS
jgi:epoxide hydrolase 4